MASKLFPSFEGVQPKAKARSTLGGKGVIGGGGKSDFDRKGFGKGGHRKVVRDSISEITKGDIRRLARCGGVKRISGQIYEDERESIRDRLTLILKDCVIFLEHSERKTMTVSDVIFALKRMGQPMYGFEVYLLRYFAI